MGMTGDKGVGSRNGKTPAATMATKPFVSDKVRRKFRRIH